MLDKTAYKILGIIASMSTDGENLVVNKDEILSLIDAEITVEELDKIISALEVNDMLKILFSDAATYCLSIRPKGKLIAEKNKIAEENAIAAAEEERAAVLERQRRQQLALTEPLEEEKEGKGNLTTIDVRKFAVICAVSSFLGGFVAAMITFLVTVFK